MGSSRVGSAMLPLCPTPIMLVELLNTVLHQRETVLLARLPDGMQRTAFVTGWLEIEALSKYLDQGLSPRLAFFVTSAPIGADLALARQDPCGSVGRMERIELH